MRQSSSRATDILQMEMGLGSCLAAREGKSFEAGLLILPTPTSLLGKHKLKLIVFSFLNRCLHDYKIELRLCLIKHYILKTYVNAYTGEKVA
jgi:hypothetical protein